MVPCLPIHLGSPLSRHQSTSQKVVQARMWAQGLTIGILIAAGIVTHSERADAAKHHAVDHSWRELLEVEAREAESRKVAQLSPASTST
jgi:Hypoxia induced protein conserved region